MPIRNFALATFVVALAAALTSCVSINKDALLINDKSNAARVDARSNGFLAIGSDVSANKDDSVVLLLRAESGQYYEVLLNPDLANSTRITIGPMVVFENKTKVDTYDFGTLVFQLPAGTYSIDQIFVRHEGSIFPKDVEKQTVTINPGKIEYVGNYKIVSLMEWIAVKTFTIERTSNDAGTPKLGKDLESLGTVDDISSGFNLKLAGKK